MKRKGNLSEELYKMRKLMGYDSKEDRENVTSLDRLVEEKMVGEYLLSEQDKQRSNQQAIDSISGNNYQKQQKDAKRNSQKTFSHYFWVRPKSEEVKIEVNDIKAFFYNNMVTLEKGLMPDTPIENVRQQIQGIVKKLKEEGYDEKSLKINIIGTASSATASEYADERLGKEQPVDHRGEAYDGKGPNNEYLAKERAKSIHSILKNLLPNAKYTVSSKIIEGGKGKEGDPVRYIKLDITGSKSTQDREITADSFLNFSYTYQEGKGFTTSQALQKYSGEEIMAQQTGASWEGGPYPTYTATLEISFGQKVPNYKGTFKMVSANYESGGRGREGRNIYKHSYKNSDKKENYTTMAILNKSGSWIENKDSEGKGMKNKLLTFLTSSGFFTTEQVKSVIKDFENPNSKLLNSMKNKKGVFKDFVSLVGGLSERKLTPEYAKNAYVDNTIKKTVTRIK
jgi:hypothetical protein